MTDIQTFDELQQFVDNLPVPPLLAAAGLTPTPADVCTYWHTFRPAALFVFRLPFWPARLKTGFQYFVDLLDTFCPRPTP